MLWLTLILSVLVAAIACEPAGELHAVDCRTPACQTGDVGEPPPAVMTAPAAVDFGWVRPGEVGRETLALMLDQPRGSLDVAGFTTSEASVFAVVAGLPATVGGADGRSRPPVTVELSFSPQRPELSRGELRLQLAGGEYEVSVPLTGTGVGPPRLWISPKDVVLHFPDQPTARIEIRNRGDADLRVTDWRTSGTAPLLVLPPDALIPPGAFERLEVELPPGAEGRWSSVLTARTTDPERPELRLPLFAERMPAAPAPAFRVDLVHESASTALWTDLRAPVLRIYAPDGSRVDAGSRDVGLGSGSLRFTSLGEPPDRQTVETNGAVPEGRYRLEVGYAADCRAASTALLASMLGIAVDAVSAWLRGWPHVRSDVDGLADACLARDGLSVVLQVRTPEGVRAKRVHLDRAGDVWQPPPILVDGSTARWSPGADTGGGK